MPTPATPAAASGPGALSRRTDGGVAQQLRELPDAQYGEAQTFRDQQKGAPLSQTPSLPAPGAIPTNPAGSGSSVPLSAPTAYPDQPLTAGADSGPGPGSDVLGQYREPSGSITAILRTLQPHDLTGAIAELFREAQSRGL